MCITGQMNSLIICQQILATSVPMQPGFIFMSLFFFNPIIQHFQGVRMMVPSGREEGTIWLYQQGFTDQSGHFIYIFARRRESHKTWILTLAHTALRGLVFPLKVIPVRHPNMHIGTLGEVLTMFNASEIQHTTGSIGGKVRLS